MKTKTESMTTSCSHYQIYIYWALALTWIIDQEFSPHASQLVVSYCALHQPCADSRGTHLNSPINT